MKPVSISKGAPRGPWLLVTVVASLALAAGVGYGAIPHSSTGVIDACYSKSGSLRVIDSEAGETCQSKERPLAWNAQGPPGPPGMTQTIIRSKLVTSQEGYGNIETVSCNAGEVATGGGYQLVSGIPSDRVQSVVGSYPDGNAIARAVGWQVQWYWTPAGEQWQIYVVCAPS